jgi:hypothetical protein
MLLRERAHYILSVGQTSSLSFVVVSIYMPKYPILFDEENFREKKPQFVTAITQTCLSGSKWAFGIMIRQLFVITTKWRGA